MTELAERAGLDATQARDLTDRIRGMVGELLPLIVEAYQRRAWVALGYAGWEEYCDAELRGIRLPIEDRRLVVAGLREDGMSTRAIGAAVGVTHTQVQRDLRQLEPSVPVVLPERVVSLDGHGRPATMPARQEVADRILAAVDEHVAAEPQGDQEDSRAYVDLRTYVDADPEVQSIQFMRRFLDALGGAGRVVEFDPERVANLAEQHEVELLRQRAEGLSRFADKVLRARSGLRLVRGEAS